ncbi:MAG TPA: CRISPR-associated endonuclease Cas2 [Anaerolineae bacterium]|nr:CRISPR-associated endonuclease Cas2 [Anaerolineae bacterium]
MGRSGRGETTCYVIAYDISDDKRRTKVHKVLSGFGQWTQYSLFECHLTAKQLVELRARLEKYLDQEADSVRFYPLCRVCVSKVITVGGSPPEDPTHFVV